MSGIYINSKGIRICEKFSSSTGVNYLISSTIKKPYLKMSLLKFKENNAEKPFLRLVFSFRYLFTLDFRSRKWNNLNLTSHL